MGKCCLGKGFSAMIRGMKYQDLRDFIQQLEKMGELKRISVEVDPYLEMT